MVRNPLSVLSEVHESATKSSRGVSRALFADFARFCLAWKIYEYFATPQIKGLTSPHNPLQKSALESERNSA